jgi:PHD/YefM family antitoxin component YafN of YafNO toxin-antitoxin module
MTITVVSSQEFDQAASKALLAANNGPVFITDHGLTTHVLMSHGLYQSLRSGRQNIADLLAMPGAADAELELRRSQELARPADWS